MIHIPHKNASTAEPLIDQKLQELVMQRVSQGFAPPREIYLVQNRSKIDWSQMPEWSWPIDPEVFDGCSHEG